MVSIAILSQYSAIDSSLRWKSARILAVSACEHTGRSTNWRVTARGGNTSVCWRSRVSWIRRQKGEIRGKTANNPFNCTCRGRSVST